MTTTKPIAPMLAVPMSKANILDWNDWMMEEKFDGWRLVVTIPASGNIVAHTRERKHAGGGPKDQNDATDLLTPDIMKGLDALRPRSGVLVLDGELIAILKDGRIGTSTDVPRKDLAGRRYTAFDVLMVREGSVMMQSYMQRRNILETLVSGVSSTGVVLSDARPCVDTETVSAFTHEVWDRAGEGLILKNRHARYEAGKRREAFVKIKKLFTAVIKVTGWEPTRGNVLNRGPFACVVGTIVEAPKGHEALVGRATSVKTKDDAELAAFANRQLDARKGGAYKQHPDIGRKLRIEYQDVAADGGVRHPRWDRWEEE